MGRSRVKIITINKSLIVTLVAPLLPKSWSWILDNRIIAVHSDYDGVIDLKPINCDNYDGKRDMLTVNTCLYKAE